ncbi:MAG: hypothetical protein ACO29L_02315 [Candidatus Methylopumilus sp.]
MKSLMFALLLGLSGLSFAGTENAAPSAEIPTNEKDFIDSISGFEKASIIAQLGEPSKVDDIQSATGKPIASIWQYHYLNKDEKGEYYQTTELDFVDDKVVMVVFMNNDGSELPADAVKATPKKP